MQQPQQQPDEEEIVDESVEETRYQQALEAAKLMERLRRLSMTPNSPVHYGCTKTQQEQEEEAEDYRMFDIRKTGTLRGLQ